MCVMARFIGLRRGRGMICKLKFDKEGILQYTYGDLADG